MKEHPEARIWATAVDLENTNQERWRYYVAIENNDLARLDVEIIVGPGKALAIEPFTPRDLDYTVHDFCNHEDGYCALDDEDTQEYEDAWLSDMHIRDVHRKPESEAGA